MHFQYLFEGEGGGEDVTPSSSPREVKHKTDFLRQYPVQMDAFSHPESHLLHIFVRVSSRERENDNGSRSVELWSALVFFYSEMPTRL